MRKLLKLREWVTVKEAAQHLSTSMSEPVTESDVLRLVLERHLVVSLYLPSGQLSVRNYSPSSERFNDLTWDDLGPYEDHSDLDLEAAVSPYYRLKGVWDFPLLGEQQFLVESEYSRLAGMPAISEGRVSSIFLLLNHKLDPIDPRNGKAYVGIDGRPLMRLVTVRAEQAAGYTVVQQLPSDAFFVIRTARLLEFERGIDETVAGESRPISTHERNTLTVIIAALCQRAGVDTRDRKAASEVVRIVAEAGASVSDDTVRSVLKRIPGALAARSR